MSQSPSELEFLPEHLIFLADCIENEVACTHMERSLSEKFGGWSLSPINISQVTFWSDYLSKNEEIENRRREARLFSLTYRLKAEEILENMWKKGLYSHNYVHREDNLFQIAKIYKEGIYVTQDLKKAEHYFYLALREGSAEALDELCNLINDGSPDEHYAEIIAYYSHGVFKRRVRDDLLPNKERDQDRTNLKLRGISWAMKRIDSPLIQYELGHLYFSDSEYDEAIKWLLKSANARPSLDTYLVLAYTFDEMGDDAKTFNWWIQTLNTKDFDDIPHLWFFSAFFRFLTKICEKYPLFNPLFEVEDKTRERTLLYRPIELCNCFISGWEQKFPNAGRIITDFFLEKIPLSLTIPEAFHSHKTASEIYDQRRDYLNAVQHLFVAIENLSTVSLDDSDLDSYETKEEVVDNYIDTLSRSISPRLFLLPKEERLKSMWWKYIEESKEPERFSSLLKSLVFGRVEILKELPESVILHLFEKTECWRLFDNHSEVSLENLFPEMSVLAKSYLPKAIR